MPQFLSRLILVVVGLAALAMIGSLALARPPAGRLVHAQALAAPAPGMAVDPGLALIQARCVACHDAGFILQDRRSAAGWRDVVNRMVASGADVNPAQTDQIVAYLTKTRLLSPQPPPQPPAPSQQPAP